MEGMWKLAKQAEWQPLARSMREVATLLCVFAPGRLVSRLILAFSLRLARGTVRLAVARLAARKAGTSIQPLAHLLLGQTSDTRRPSRLVVSTPAALVVALALVLHGGKQLLVHLAQLGTGHGRRRICDGCVDARVIAGFGGATRCHAREREQVLHGAEIHRTVA